MIFAVNPRKAKLMSFPIDDNTTIRDLVGRYPQTRQVFEKHGIDCCCGGGRRLDVAASERGIAVSELLADLQAALNGPSAAHGPVAKDWSDAPLRELVDHILRVHHAYLREALPRVSGLLQKVSHAHDKRHGKMLGGVQRQFAMLTEELTDHMMKEEMVLFPHVVAAEAHRQGNGLPLAACFSSVSFPIRQMESEHEAAGNALRAIREATGGYILPPDCCPTFRALYDELQQLEADLHEHVHLENNILFPRAIAAETPHRCGAAMP
jgi:regulator of cell morphogenesis and NO signaling